MQGLSAVSFSGDYLSIETRENGVAIVRLDDKKAKVNTLSANMTEEFVKMLKSVEEDERIKSVVLISGKVGHHTLNVL